MPRDRHCDVQRHRSARDVRGQVLPLNEFHRKGSDGGLFEPVDLGDVRMVQRGERPRLAREAGQLFRTRGKRRRQDLDRDVAIERRVARAVDLAHPARTERADDFVGTQALA